MHVMFVCVFKERESLQRERERKRFTKNSNSLNERDIFKRQTQL